MTVPDRVFVLGTGRCGTRTWAAACGHIDNWTSGHETRNRLFAGRLDYPQRHIEVDNRLVFHLGGLQRLYGDDPLFVHLTRDPEAVAASLAHGVRGRRGIMPAFVGHIIRSRRVNPMEAARIYVETVTDNIEAFLSGKPNVIRVRIEQPHAAFDQMWEQIGAVGDREAAHGELDQRHGERTRKWRR